MEGFEFEIPAIEIPEIEIPEIEIPETEIPDMEFEMEEGAVEVQMEYENFRPKAKNPNRRAPQKSKGARVKDYIRCSVITVTFFNFMFLGTAALICSLKAINRKIGRDVAGAKRFGCWALTANIFAIIGTIIAIISISVVISNTYRNICKFFVSAK